MTHAYSAGQVMTVASHDDCVLQSMLHTLPAVQPPVHTPGHEPLPGGLGSTPHPPAEPPVPAVPELPALPALPAVPPAPPEPPPPAAPPVAAPPSSTAAVPP
jgi:homeobox protein ESX1